MASDIASSGDIVGANATVSPARVFWATWFGWMLDGFDSGIYIFVLVPALTTLLHDQGLPADKGHVALYGGFLFSLFMVGWACSMFWGWMADRIGRVRVMCWTMLIYSAGTALCGVAPSLVWFALFRFIAGFGVGGDWAAGTPLLHESLPESSRVRITGYLHTATPIGGLLAAGASFLVPVLGWRGGFVLGALPALMVLWLRVSLPEPAAPRRSGHSLTRKPEARGCSISRTRCCRSSASSRTVCSPCSPCGCRICLPWSIAASGRALRSA